MAVNDLNVVRGAADTPDMSRSRDRISQRSHPAVATVPDLLGLWHPTRNEVSPTGIKTGSTRRVWWQCPVAEDHEWDAALQSVAISVASGYRGCPFCRGLRASVTNSVRSVLPLSSEQWHPTRNGDLTPDDVVAGSNSKFWWKCKAGPDHEWATAPVTRHGASDGSCPFCVNRSVSVTNMLSLHAPEVAAQWHVTRNGDLTPGDVVVTTQRRVWWDCPNGPGHVWESPVHLRTDRGMGCPFCSGRRLHAANSVQALIPLAAAMWHPSKNGTLTPEQVKAGSGEQFWWKCGRGPDHEWECAPVVLRRSLTTKNRGCPFCAGNRASVTNDLNTLPRLAAEFHPTRNGDRTPADIPAGTQKKIWWQCAKNPEHEWRASVVNRAKGRNCPFCKTSLRSAWEICVAYELQTIFDGIDLTDDKINDHGKPIHVDILIPGPRIAIEIDGTYHHADREDADCRKSTRINATDWKHLRIREHPLTAINREDVLVEADATMKTIVDLLLRRLSDLGWVPEQTAPIDAYLAETDPRRMDEALADVSAARGGKKVRKPGTPKGPNRDSLWETGYAHLLTFVEREGHAQPPFDHTETGHRLGSWVSVQRKRHRTGVLQPDRLARLEALADWSWDPLADTFETKFAIYENYIARTGNAYVAVAHEEQGIRLGQWVRCLHRGTIRLTDEQRARLEALPGWTWNRQAWANGGPSQETLFDV